MQQQRLIHLLSWVYLVILVVLPFHAFLTTWLGSSFGNLDMWRIWKEVIICVTVPFGAYLAWVTPTYRKWLTTAWLPRLIAAFVVLYLLAGVFAVRFGATNIEALVYSWLSNLRYLGFFLLISVAAARSAWLRRYAPRTVMVAGVIVVGFGLLQLVLPHDFLSHFGYGPETIPAYHTVDNKLDYQRVQSTLRGPNPLGAYLVVLLSILVAYWRLSSRPFSWKLIGSTLAVLTVLMVSYSRSAYLGALVSMGVIVFAAFTSSRLRRYALVAAAVVLVIVSGAVFMLRDNNVVQNTVFHSDETSQSAMSSNTGRASALQNGWYDMIHEPFGRGPGTAGPASARNDDGPRIAENYFLQIGQEVGWIGVALYVAIIGLVGRMLWALRADYLSMALLASLIGLTVVNLVSHAWADDTLGLLWWGLAGIALAPAIIEQKANKQHEIPVPKKRKKRS